MNSENFKNHQIFEKIEQISNRLQQNEAKELIEIEKYVFFETTIKYITNKLNITIPTILQESELNNISSELESGLSQINN